MGIEITKRTSIEGALATAHNNLPVQLGDSSNLDSSGRLRTSNPYSLFTSKFEYSKLSHYWNEKTIGTANSIHVPQYSSVRLNAPANGDYIIRQTSHFPYQPGNSQLILLTFVMENHQIGGVKQIGYYDERDGWYFEQSNGTYYLVLRTSVSGSIDDTTYRVAQLDWNLDKLDGFGPSKENVDFSKVTVSIMDLLWLGGDRVRCGFKIAGKIIYVHEFNFANQINSLYMRSATLPLRVELSNNGGSNISFLQGCASIKVEAGQALLGSSHVASTGLISAPVIQGVPGPDGRPLLSSMTSILAIRPKALFLGLTNRITSIPLAADLTTAGNSNVYWQLLHNPILTGGTWYDIDSTSSSPSSLEQNTTAGLNLTGNPHIHRSGIALSTNKGSGTPTGALEQNIFLSRGIDPAIDSEASLYVVAACGIGGTATVQCEINLVELH